MDGMYDTKIDAAGYRITWPSQGTATWASTPVYPNTVTTGGKTNMNASTTAVPAVGGFRPQIRTMSGEVLWEGNVVRRHDKAVRAAEKHLNTKLRELLNA